VPPLAADHNIDERILDGLARRLPNLDILQIRRAGLAEAVDPDVLAWAMTSGRVLRTHDRKTMVRFANERVIRGKPMPGVILIDGQCPVGRAINDLLVLLECTADDEWADQIHYIPL
jgi:predicted nuclease of predicted toxin-antitoxin system